MRVRFILTDYVNQALAKAVYDKLEDGTFAGRIPLCPGVVAFGRTLPECEAELRSTLEDWILVGLKLGHPLPIIGGIDLNEEPHHEPSPLTANIRYPSYA
jgi:predicted RNase H-like HicB family nuclease